MALVSSDGLARAIPRHSIMFLVLLLTPFMCGFKFYSELKNEQGNKYYQKGEVGKAKSAYTSALKSEPDSPEIAFNLGNAYYKEESFKESLDVFKKAAKDAKGPLLQSEAFYNLGNTLVRNQERDKAIEFYKQSLRINAADEDAKYNLELLTKKPKDKDQKKDKNKDQQKKQDQQNKKDQSQQNQSGGQGQSSEQNKQDQQNSQGAGGSSEQNKDEAQKDQQSQGAGGSQSKEDQKQPQEGQRDKGQGQTDQQQQPKEGQEEQSKGGASQQGQEKKPEQSQEKQPKKSESELRAEQILDALGDREQQVLKLNTKQRIQRARPYVEKDW